MFSTAPGKHPGLLRKLAGHRWVHHSLPRWGGRRTLCPGALHGASDAVHPSGRGTPPTRQRLRREKFRSVCTTDPGGIFMGSAVGGIMITKGFSLALWPTRVLSRAGVERDGHNQLSLSRCKRPSGSHQLSPDAGEHQGGYQSTINHLVPAATIIICTGQKISTGPFLARGWGGVAEWALWPSFCINPNPDPTWPLLPLSGFLWPPRVCGHFAEHEGALVGPIGGKPLGDGLGWKALWPCGRRQ